MTPKEAVNEIKLIVDTIDENLLRVMDGALNNLYGEFMERIFNDKKDANESSLGQYSTKPTLIGAKSFRNKGESDRFFKSQTKDENSKSNWRTLKNGKKAFILNGGYKELGVFKGYKLARLICSTEKSY
jgi:hypothetical protein